MNNPQTNANSPPPWKDVVVVEITEKVCPHCGTGVGFDHMKTKPHPWVLGVRIQQQLCRHCMQRVVWHVYPPENIHWPEPDCD